MPKNDAVEMDGTVIDALPNSQFTVRLDNGHQLLAYTGGRMRRFRIRILLGDRVLVSSGLATRLHAELRSVGPSATFTPGLFGAPHLGRAPGPVARSEQALRRRTF